MREQIQVPLEIKAASDAGAIEGYGSVFGNVDLGGDIVAPGAFRKSIEAKASAKQPIPMLWQHDTKEPIGVWDAFEEDQRGLIVKGQIFVETTRGKDAAVFARRGAVRGLSIGYITRDYSNDHKTGIRTLKELDIHEVSLVTMPMNPQATVTGVKFLDAVSEMTEREIERWLREDAHRSSREIKAAISRLMDLGSQRDAAEIEASLRRQLAADSLLKALRG